LEYNALGIFHSDIQKTAPPPVFSKNHHRIYIFHPAKPALMGGIRTAIFPPVFSQIWAFFLLFMV
jgi:hypothetical protein